MAGAKTPGGPPSPPWDGRSGQKVISAYSQVYAPFILIEANDSLADDIDGALIKFEYSDDDKKPDQLTLTVENNGLDFVDDLRFREGTTFRLRWGYANDVSDLRTVKIVKAKPNFPAKGVPTMTLMAWDLRVDMNKSSKAENHGAISSSAVAAKIAARLGFKDTDIEDSKDARKQARIQPLGTTDILYLQTLANALNWDLYISKDTLHFHHKRFEEAPQFEFTYFTDGTGTLIEFTPEVDMKNPAKAGTASANPKDAKAKTTTPDNGPTMANAQRYVVETNAGKKKGVGGVGVPTPETDKKVAGIGGDARKDKIDMTAVKAKMKVIGTPKLRSKMNVIISGVGRTYSGIWRVESTKHPISPTGEIYITEVGLTRNALNGPTGKKADKTNDKDVGDGKNKTKEVLVTQSGAHRGTGG